MFNSTHTLVGLAVARTAPGGWLRYAATTAVLASNLPDIDIITEIVGAPTYIEYHRGMTHSLLGVPILALGLALVMCVFSENFWRTYAIAFASMATHPLLDYANTYGLRPFLPFDGMWYYGDTLFVIDPYLDGILLIGILAAQRFRNVSQFIIWVTILFAVAYIGIRVQLRNEARAQLEGFSSALRNVERSAVLPQALDPTRWYGIVETKTEVVRVQIDAVHGLVGGINRTARGSWSQIVARAALSPAAAAFLGFARFPVTRVEGAQFGYRVTFIDYRFYDELENTAFTADVQLDRSLNVVKDRLGFNQPAGLK